MIALEQEIAAATGAEVAGERRAGGPPRGRRSTRARPGPGDLFFGLPGERATAASSPPPRSRRAPGGSVVGPERRELGASGAAPRAAGWVFAAADPLAALQALARAWRRALGARVVGITGSVGKTSVKDICRALLPGERPRQPARTSTPRSACR